MSNKVKDIFSDDMFNINGTLRFSNDEAYKNFLAAMEIAYAEGRVVPVEGVTSVATTVGHQSTKFPLEEHTNITQFFVGPAVEPVPISLDVCGEEKIITLLRSRIKDRIVLRSEPESIVTFNFTFLLGENRHTVNYKVQFEKAKSIKEVADSFSLATALLNRLYRQEDNAPSESGKVSLSNVKEYFRCYSSFFKRLSSIEDRLGLSISPELLNDLPREEQQDIDELYLLLCENKVVRLNAKLTSSNSTSVAMNSIDTPLNIGQKIALTFLSTIEFSFLKQTVTLHTANLLVNAHVKEIQKDDDGTVKVLYGDTDSKPMYIAYSAFETKEEATREADCILQHDKTYINALTEAAYINQLYS